MDITITGRNLGVTDRFREYATEKASKIDHLAERAIAFDVKVSAITRPTGSSGDDRVELTLVGPGPLVRAEANGSDKYVAFDLAMGKLVERIRQAKDRKKVHRGQHRPVSLREAATGGFRGAGCRRRPAPRRSAPSRPARSRCRSRRRRRTGPRRHPQQGVPGGADDRIEDAVDHMELVGHDFFLFIDARPTGRASSTAARAGTTA